MIYESRFHLGSLALALMAAAATCAVTLLAMGLLHGASVDFVSAVLILPLYFAGGLFIAVLFALPVLFVMRPMGLINRWSTMLLGAIIGALNGWMSALPGVTFDVVAWVVAGTLSGLAGWTVWMWRDRRRKRNVENAL